MHLALLLSVQTAAASLVSTIAPPQGAPGTGQVFSGRSGQLQVTAPRVEAGHANNALPQTARAVLNCRILPGEATAPIEAAITTVTTVVRIGNGSRP